MPTVPQCGGQCPRDYAVCSGDSAGVCSRTVWTLDPPPSTPAVANDLTGEWSGFDQPLVSYQEGLAHSGRYAASLEAIDNSSGGYATLVRTRLCPSGGDMDLSGKTVSVWFYFSGPSTVSDNQPPCSVFLASTVEDKLVWEAPFRPTPLFWYEAKAKVTPQTKANQLAVQCRFSEWGGSVFMDDVSIRD